MDTEIIMIKEGIEGCGMSSIAIRSWAYYFAPKMEDKK